MSAKLYACYDGKLGRAMPAKVVKVRGCFRLVEFQPWTGKRGEVVRAWFPPAGGAWVRSKGSLMPMLGVRGANESGGDWYRLVDKSVMDEARRGV